jgi:hypothetical protein
VKLNDFHCSTLGSTQGKTFGVKTGYLKMVLLKKYPDTFKRAVHPREKKRKTYNINSVTASQ